jgi:hypothetical protein
MVAADRNPFRQQPQSDEARLVSPLAWKAVAEAGEWIRAIDRPVTRKATMAATDDACRVTVFRK